MHIRRIVHGHSRQPADPEAQTLLGQPRRQRLVQRSDAVIVEARRNGSEHRHVLGIGRERGTITLHLLPHVAQRVVGATPVELVDRHNICKVQHVDLFQLAGGAELGGHHVQ